MQTYILKLTIVKRKKEVMPVRDEWLYEIKKSTFFWAINQSSLFNVGLYDNNKTELYHATVPLSNRGTKIIARKLYGPINPDIIKEFPEK